jgi:hypothetical protein
MMIIRLFHGPDGAPPGAAAEPAPAQGAAPAAEAPAEAPPSEGDDLPKFASQLSPEIREKRKTELSALKGKHLNDVMEDYFGIKGKLDGAIVPPGKDAKPEEVDAFFKKMGIPRTADEYKLNTEAVKSMDKDGAFTKGFREIARKNGLTQRQAENIFNTIAAGMTQDSQTKEAKAKEVRGTFDARLAEAVGDPAKAKETGEYFKRFIVSIGDKELVKELHESNVLYSPRFARAMAEYHKKYAGDPSFVDGHGPAGGAEPKGTGKKLMAHSDQFEEHYGKKGV